MSTNDEARNLTNISFAAHLRYLQGRVGGKRRSDGFIAGALMAMRLSSEPGSQEYNSNFKAFTSMGFEGSKGKSANDAKELYVEIYSRLKSHMIGRSERFWIQRI